MGHSHFPRVLLWALIPLQLRRELALGSVLADLEIPQEEMNRHSRNKHGHRNQQSDNDDKQIGDDGGPIGAGRGTSC